MQGPTLLHDFYRWSQEAPDAPAHASRHADQWKTQTIQQVAQDVLALARFFSQRGRPGFGVGAIFAYNSSEWVKTDLALMLAGKVTAGIYLNASGAQIQHILNHSNAEFIVLDRWEDLKRALSAIGLKGRYVPPGFQKISAVTEAGTFSVEGLHRVEGAGRVEELTPADLKNYFPSLKHLIFLKEKPVDLSGFCLSFEEAVRLGQNAPNQTFESFLGKIDPSSMATLIYTSGTTGIPKGVALSYRNLKFAASTYSSTWTPPKHGKQFSFLPLAHIAERMTTICLGVTRRYTVHFSSSPMTIASELREVQPTILLCVPRLWDKLKEGVETKLDRATDRQKKILNWAMGAAREYWTAQLEGRSQFRPDLYLKWRLADLLALRKIRQQMGLANVARAASGASALSRSTVDWYLGLGVVIIEAYALSETSGTLTCGSANEMTLGTVGKPYAGIEVRLADDGEVEVRGPNVFMGYYKDPEATAQVFKDGWLKTGDLARWDKNGNLNLVGRKREIIKTSEGKMVSPLMIEGRLSTLPWIEQVVVIGSERPHLVALMTLKAELNCSREEAQAFIQQALAGINRDLASHERIKNFTILEKSFSIESEELTATMKIRRHIIEQRYSDLISSLYS